MKNLIILITTLLLSVNIAMAKSTKQPMVIVPVNGVKSVTSHHSVVETSHHLLTLLKKHHFLIKGLINHQAIAISLKHYVRPNIAILAGKPSFEYPLIKASPEAALFVPLTFIVWQDQHKTTHISYWDPITNIVPLLHIHNSRAIHTAKKMSALLAKMTANAAK